MDDYLCLACRDQDESSLSIVRVIDGEKVTEFYIGDHVRMDQNGDDLHNAGITINREWISSNAHRGHYNTKISGWTEVMVGWTTGNWGDSVSNRKQLFNEWVEGVLSKTIDSPVSFAIVTDPTSNLFSTGIAVSTLDVSGFNYWIDSEFPYLRDALS